MGSACSVRNQRNPGLDAPPPTTQFGKKSRKCAVFLSPLFSFSLDLSRARALFLAIFFLDAEILWKLGGRDQKRG